MSPSRLTAFQVLMQVEAGGYASDLLRSRTQRLSSKDAGLASEIVFGCLRRQQQLDSLIGQVASRPASRMDPEVRQVLRMGLYQLLHLDRVPARAAVSESVELARQAGKASAAGFVNAILRKVEGVQPVWPDQATELSVPEWLLAKWRGQFGAETAAGIARAFLKPPETYLRIPSGLPPEGIQAEPADVPGCFRWLSGDKGGFRVQDVGSQAVVPLLDLRPGLRFMDLCAAPGNKTAQALESGIWTVACDLHLSRLRRMTALGCPLVGLDGTRPLPFRARFDRILVDAPCSGTGTLGRNPEIKWRLRPEDLEDLHGRQVRLLRNALEVLAPGGRLVYSTCSLEREENEAVLEEVLGRVPFDVWRRVPGVNPGDGFYAAVLGST